MDASKVRNLRWVPVTDWTGLPKTTWQKEECGGRYDYYVSECDINSFVDNIFRDVARKLDVSYEKVGPILREENKAFEETKGRLFLKYDYVAENDEASGADGRTGWETEREAFFSAQNQPARSGVSSPVSGPAAFRNSSICSLVVPPFPN